MRDWRCLRGWSEAELEARLARARDLGLNFSPERVGPDRGWKYYYSQAVIGRMEPGPPVPGGVFERARVAVVEYRFSDPRIVVAHFDPTESLEGRRMLLEIKVLGLRYLCPVVVGAVRSETREDRTVFGFRYETLEGHIESGFEWFLLTKDHESGATWFRIQATWRPGQFPNWWSRVGFRFLVRRYQRAWHRLAYLRLREVVGARGLAPVPAAARLLHEGPELPNPGVWTLSGKEIPPPIPRPRAEAEGAERRRGTRRPPRP